MPPVKIQPERDQDTLTPPGRALSAQVTLTTDAEPVSGDDYYLPGDYPFNIRLIMSERTGQDEFAIKFFSKPTIFMNNYEALIVIRTDGSAWENYDFDSLADSYDLALTGVIPSPDSDGLYTVDFYFSETGLVVRVMDVVVVTIDSDAFVTEVKSWESGVGIALYFDQSPPTTLKIQVHICISTRATGI